MRSRLTISSDVFEVRHLGRAIPYKLQEERYQVLCSEFDEFGLHG
jgi:hypothetical protein